MDPASCGPHVQTAEVPEVILMLNEEYNDLFPCALPPGLPPSRPTDHRIDFPVKYKIPAPRLYRLAPSDDADKLNGLTEHGYIEPVTSPFG